MTGQDWAIIGAGWLALALVIGGFWLDQRALAKRLHRHRRQLDQLASTATAHGQALARADLLPTASYRAMASVTGTHRAIGTYETMATVRRRPPSIVQAELPSTPANASFRPETCIPAEQSDIERVLAKAGRPLTRMELGRCLGMAPWELLSPIKTLMLAGKLTMAPSHTEGEPGYTLAGDTLRLPSGMVVSGG